MKVLILAAIVTLLASPVMLLCWLLMRIGIYFTKNKTDPETIDNRNRTALYSPGKMW